MKQTMDSNPPKMCRLCLLTSENAVNIWETFQESSIASILAKHFWFQVHQNDGFTNWICQMCWSQTKSFHEFYKSVERYHKFLLDSAEEKDEKVNVEPDEIVDEKDAVFESYLNLDYCETKSALQTINVQVSKNDSSDYSDYDDVNFDKSETTRISHQTTTKKLKVYGDTASSHSLSEKERLNARVRELFTMKCEICARVEFENLLEARRHYRSVHKTAGYLMCCAKKFRLRSEILDHIRYHSNPMLQSQIEDEDARIRELFTMKCEFCSDIEFENFIKAKEHYLSVHQMRGYLMCCGTKFWRRFEIRKHVLSHDPDAFRCNECGKRCGNKDGLQRHIDSHVPLDSRAYKCSFCSSTFARGYLLKQHMKNQHSSKAGDMFPCDKCEKNFRSKLLLGHHIRNVHEYTLDHVCEICARRFKKKQLLQNHITSQHSTTPQPKVQCDICGAWLKHKEILKKHLKAMHSEGNSEAVKCNICEKLVKNKTALRGHMKTVHGERRHQCSLCDKAFKTAFTLREHTAIHTGEDLYNCPHCEKKFKSRANMHSHRKKAHSAECARGSTQRDTLNENATNTLK